MSSDNVKLNSESAKTMVTGAGLFSANLISAFDKYKKTHLLDPLKVYTPADLSKIQEELKNAEQEHIIQTPEKVKKLQDDIELRAAKIQSDAKKIAASTPPILESVARTENQHPPLNVNLNHQTGSRKGTFQSTLHKNRDYSNEIQEIMKNRMPIPKEAEDAFMAAVKDQEQKTVSDAGISAEIKQQKKQDFLKLCRMTRTKGQEGLENFKKAFAEFKQKYAQYSENGYININQEFFNDTKGRTILHIAAGAERDPNIDIILYLEFEEGGDMNLFFNRCSSIHYLRTINNHYQKYLTRKNEMLPQLLQVQTAAKANREKMAAEWKAEKARTEAMRRKKTTEEKLALRKEIAIAATKTNLKTVEDLISKFKHKFGADAFDINEYGNGITANLTIMHYVANSEKPNEEILAHLILKEKGKMDSPAKNNEKITPMYYLMKHPHKHAACQKLLDNEMKKDLDLKKKDLDAKKKQDENSQHKVGMDSHERSKDLGQRYGELLTIGELSKFKICLENYINDFQSELKGKDYRDFINSLIMHARTIQNQPMINHLEELLLEKPSQTKQAVSKKAEERPVLDQKRSKDINERYQELLSVTELLKFKIYLENYINDFPNELKGMNFSFFISAMITHAKNIQNKPIENHIKKVRESKRKQLSQNQTNIVLVDECTVKGFEDKHKKLCLASETESVSRFKELFVDFQNEFRSQLSDKMYAEEMQRLLHFAAKSQAPNLGVIVYLVVSEKVNINQVPPRKGYDTSSLQELMKHPEKSDLYQKVILRIKDYENLCKASQNKKMNTDDFRKLFAQFKAQYPDASPNEYGPSDAGNLTLMHAVVACSSPINIDILLYLELEEKGNMNAASAFGTPLEMLKDREEYDRYVKRKPEFRQELQAMQAMQAKSKATMTPVAASAPSAIAAPAPSTDSNHKKPGPK